MNISVHSYGHSALERMAETPNFNKWTYETIAPFLTGKILEIGSGIGNLSQYFLIDQKDITLTDYDLQYTKILEDKFKKFTRNIFQLDLIDENFSEKFAHVTSSFDSIFLLNVLEHINNDDLAIKNCQSLLKPDGTLLILVPAHHFLFSKMDLVLGHYRRYTSNSLKKLVERHNFTCQKKFYFNSLGLLGWGLKKITKETTISHREITTFNKLVPLAKLLDKLTSNTIGLSTVVIAKKGTIK